MQAKASVPGNAQKVVQTPRGTALPTPIVLVVEIDVDAPHNRRLIRALPRQGYAVCKACLRLRRGQLARIAPPKGSTRARVRDPDEHAYTCGGMTCRSCFTAARRRRAFRTRGA